MKYFHTVLLAIILLFIIFISFLSSKKDVRVDNDSKRLCMEYALRDHEKEIAPSRWEWLKQFGNPNDVEFFYQSCIGHVTGITATKEYMK